MRYSLRRWVHAVRGVGRARQILAEVRVAAGLPLVLAVPAAFAAPSLAAEDDDPPRVIVLAFDGLDAGLVERWMASGDLPHLAAMKEAGGYARLGTTIPPLSPVAWPTALSGVNPGRHGLFGFVARDNGGPLPLPRLSVTRREAVPRDEVAAAIGDPADTFADILGRWPEQVEVPRSEIAATFLHEYLDAAGRTFVGLRVPATFPVTTPLRQSRILSGLFTPDVAGGPGRWYVFTNDEWVQSDLPTETGGTTYRLWGGGGVFEASLPGPVDWVTRAKLEAMVRGLQEEALAAADDGERAALDGALERARARLWEHRLHGRYASVPLRVHADPSARAARIVLGEHDVEVQEGAWIHDLALRFDVPDSFPVRALVSLRLDVCRLDEDEDADVRLFVTPLAIDPRTTRGLMPFAWPRTYGEDLWERAGAFRTLGWDCATNAWKDGEIGPQAFLETVESSLDGDRRLLDAELARGHFDVLFAGVEAADRAGHLLLAFGDGSRSPKSGGATAADDVAAFGAVFPLGDALRRVYRECDAIVGAVADLVASGVYGDDALLLVLSDHGMAPFRYGANLNVWLERSGYLVRDGDRSGDLPDYIDWARTRAYSMDLGKVYLNLAGREPQGVVDPADGPALLRAIAADLEAWTDPATGARVVRRAHLAEDVYQGPMADADLVVGFEPPYRASWRSSLGGFETDAIARAGIVENHLPWSGDHGCDASAVPGVLFTSRPLPAGVSPGLLDVAPTVLRWMGVEVPETLEGVPIPLR